jgi:hypothetical protein
LGACCSFSCRFVLLTRFFIVLRFDFWVPRQRSSSWCWIPHLPPKLLFFFLSPISVSACLHLLSRDLFSPFFPVLNPSHSQDNPPVPIFFASHRAAVLVS